MGDAVNERQIRDLLMLIDEPVEPPPELSDRIRAEMISELDHAASEPGTLLTLELRDLPRDSRRRRWPFLVVAAAAAAVLIVVAIQGGGGTVEREQSVVTATPPPYLTACADFQTAATVGTQRWFRVIPDLDLDDPASHDYLDGLAAALDQLTTVPAASQARAHLAAAAVLARSEDPGAVLTEIVEELDQARTLLEVATGHGCLDNRTVELEP
jgi:hypothetical protein